MTEWLNCLIIDMLGDLCFGTPFETKEPGHNDFEMIPEPIAPFKKILHPVYRSDNASD